MNIINMSKILLISIVTAALCAVAVHCEKSFVLLEAFEHLLNAINIYNEKLDKSVPWAKLKGAIDALDSTSGDFEGDASNYMERIRDIKSKSFATYARASRTIFEWCITTNSSLDIYFRYEGDQLSGSDGRTVRELLLKILKSGEQQIKDSKNQLNFLEKYMAELRTLVGQMAYALKDDFRPTSGVYGVRRAQLEKELDRTKSNTGMALILSVFVVLASAVLGLVFGPIGLAIGLSVALASAGIPIAILKGHVTPSIKQRILIIDTYFETLEKAIQNANGALDEVEKELTIEVDRVSELLGLIEAAADKVDSDLILSDFWRPKEVQPTLRNVQNLCKEYVNRHGLTKGPKRRRRRYASIAMGGNQGGKAGELHHLNENYSQSYIFDVHKYI